MERRQSFVDVVSDTHQSGNHRGRMAGQRIWGGSWPDLSLVAMALLLVAVLDLYPRQKAPTENITARAPQAVIIKQQKPIVVATRRPRISSPKVREKKIQPVNLTKDKYASLRDAWGG